MTLLARETNHTFDCKSRTILALGTIRSQVSQKAFSITHSDKGKRSLLSPQRAKSSQVR